MRNGDPNRSFFDRNNWTTIFFWKNRTHFFEISKKWFFSENTRKRRRPLRNLIFLIIEASNRKLFVMFLCAEPPNRNLFFFLKVRLFGCSTKNWCLIFFTGKNVSQQFFTSNVWLWLPINFVNDERPNFKSNGSPDGLTWRFMQKKIQLLLDYLLILLIQCDHYGTYCSR